MSRMKYQQYISKAYIPEVVEALQEKYPNFSKETYLGQDKILRKFHLIGNLMNTITLNEITEMEISGIKRRHESDSGSSILQPTKKIKREDIADNLKDLLNMGVDEVDEARPGPSRIRTPSPFYCPVSPDYEHMDMDEDLDEAVGNFEWNSNPVSAMDQPKESCSFRFFCPLLLGVGSASLILQLKQIGITIDDAFPVYDIDIVDRETKKIIFITEKRRESTLAFLISKYGEFLPSDQVGTIRVDYNSGDCTMENCTGLNIDSAKNFLAHRKKMMVENYEELDVPDIHEGELICHTLDLKRSLWADPVMASANSGEQVEFEDEDLNMPTSFPNVKLDDILESLEDIFETRKELEEAHWNGKILPYSVVKEEIYPVETTDTEIFRDFFPQGEIEILSEKGVDKNDLLTFHQFIVEMLQREETTSMSIIKIAKTLKKTAENNYIKEKNLYEALRCIGWGRKGKQVSAESARAASLKQKEYPVVKPKAYPSWMPDVFQAEAADSGYECLHNLDFREGPIMHPIDEVTTKCCEVIRNIFTSMNVAITVALYMNLSSRLGGAYMVNISGQNKLYTSLAAIPIVANAKKSDGTEIKIVTGFVFRGPHHVRDGTDRIGLVTLERIKGGINVGMFKKGLVVRINGELWFLAKNSINRASPTYGAFLHNLLFIPTNFIGDMVLNVFSDFVTLKAESTDLIMTHKDFLKHRFVELGFMGLLGGSQEEGYFSGYRMLFMVLLELSRGQHAALIEQEGFFKSINECVISNCYVLFMHGNLLYTLRYIKAKLPEGSKTFVI